MDKRQALTREEALALVRRYKEVISPRFAVAPKVMMFGSYSKGYANPDSDIDVAVIVPTYGDRKHIVYGFVAGCPQHQFPHRACPHGRRPLVAPLRRRDADGSHRIITQSIVTKSGNRGRGCRCWVLRQAKRQADYPLYDLKRNVFVKPNDQSQTCLSLGMARKQRMKIQCFYSCAATLNARKASFNA